MSIFSKRAASVVFVGALSTFGGGIASAEEQGPADQPARNAGAPAELEEIVVTARYRAESLQDTPISISALTANDLQARGITDVTGLTAVTPSTTLVKEGSTGGNTLVAYIRGLGQANYSLAFQPGVPIYVDDIYQPTAFGSMLTLGDIERVDVLRGSVLGDARHAPADLDVAIGIFRIQDGERHARPFRHVPRLHAALGGIHAQ